MVDELSIGTGGHLDPELAFLRMEGSCSPGVIRLRRLVAVEEIQLCPGDESVMCQPGTVTVTPMRPAAPVLGG
jgi:hypothetical protein